ncbi:iron ABC transporter ATP-binding protein [Mycoplasma ovis str. Michigan]|uniref:Iron ABC transporter ATP-binding protein n=2 Tax=Mycoplasma ovis TaxID=171632 RepID=A0ABN4BLQ4_9MOLU|nr:iron ABC transporter ATP-binding protein [Mycoplasma ovis str. Michigan]
MKYAIQSLPVKSWDQMNQNSLEINFKTPLLKTAFPEISLSSSKKLLVISNLSFSYKTFSSAFYPIYKFLAKREKISQKWSKYLANKNKEKLIQSINLSLMSKKFIAVVGRNGSGKSTIAKIIVNLLSNYEGQVYWIGKNLQDISIKSFARNVAYIPQHSIMYQDISLFDFISVGFAPSEGLITSKFSKEEKEKRIYSIIQELGLEKESGKSLNALSGGNRQKAIIARSIAQGTKIIVLDEPLNFLDIKSRIMVLDYLKFLQTERGVTIIMIHHDIEQIREYLDEVVIIDQGFLEAHLRLNLNSK